MKLKVYILIFSTSMPVILTSWMGDNRFFFFAAKNQMVWSEDTIMQFG